MGWKKRKTGCSDSYLWIVMKSIPIAPNFLLLFVRYPFIMYLIIWQKEENPWAK